MRRALALAAAALFSQGLACAERGGAAAPDAGATIPSASRRAEAAAPACPAQPLPPGVPAGWTETSDWSCDCRFYTPGSKDALPPPIAWEPCPERPGGMECRVMKADWTASPTPIALNPLFDQAPGGAPLLLFRRVAEDAPPRALLDLVAEVDGPVRAAILQLPPPGQPAGAPDPGCHLEPEALRDGRWLLAVRGHDAAGHASGSSREGVLGGPVDDLRPTVLARQDDDLRYDWALGGPWLLRVDSRRRVALLPWSAGDERPVTSAAADPEGLAPVHPIVRGDAVFWTGAAGPRAGINVWDPERGARPFLRWIGDPTRGAGNLGTDGVDLVWTQGEAGDPAGGPLPVRSLMTAPYTADPAALRPRRLRAAPHPSMAAAPIKVACGHAAQETGDGDVMVVRLSDGVAWRLPSAPPAMSFRVPIGLTCDEVFVVGRLGGRYNVARVRLDSLGPGLPPD